MRNVSDPGCCGGDCGHCDDYERMMNEWIEDFTFGAVVCGAAFVLGAGILTAICIADCRKKA